MLICKVTISYEHGIKANRADDLGLWAPPESRTPDGGVLRGLGTHYVSEEAAELHKARQHEDQRIRTEVRSRFAFSPLPGTYMVRSKDEMGQFLARLNIQPDVQATAHVYDLTSLDEIKGAELREWSERIVDQLQRVSLGATSEADADGLACLESLASCPVLSRETSVRLREMVAAGRMGTMGRLAIKRAIKTLDVELAPDALSPRCAPILTESVPVDIDPIRVRRPTPTWWELVDASAGA